MARQNTPWFNNSKGGWFVKYRGRLLSLRVKGRENRDRALVAFERLKAGHPVVAPPTANTPAVRPASSDPYPNTIGEPDVPNPNRPWYRSAKDGWYVKVAGRCHSLGVKGRDNQEQALIAFDRLKARLAPPTPPVQAAVPPTQPTVGPILPVIGSLLVKFLSDVATALQTGTNTEQATLRSLFDRFRTDAKTRLKPKTVTRYEYDVNDFLKTFGDRPARSLTADHIRQWAGGETRTGTTKGIMLRSLKAFLSWCVREELLDKNPAKRVPVPKTRSRSEEVLISEADHQKLMAAATPDFRLVLRTLHDSGCRPGEIGKLTVENFKPEQRCFVLKEHKTDRTGKPRPILCSPELVEELKKLADQYGTGPLLRNDKKDHWSSRAITEGMKRLRNITGVRAIAYGYRHTFVTDALASGTSDALAAQLAGHSGTTVIHRNYSHLGARMDVLREALGRFRGG